VNGHIKFFKRDKGWGMIEASDRKGDVFFHLNHLPQDASPREGMAVEFSLNPEYPKRRALTVTLLGKLAYVPINEQSRKAVVNGD
jgi:cold shock CspA family protein